MANDAAKKLEIGEVGTYWVVPDEEFRRVQQQTPRIDQKSLLALELLARLGGQVLTIPFLIKHFREQKMWTQRKLDEESGIPYSRICNFEKGDAVPEQSSLDKLGAALGADFNRAIELVRQLTSS